MYQPPSNSNEELNPNLQAIEDEADLLNSIIQRAEAEDLSVQGVIARRQELKRLFAWLLGIGFGLGILIAIALLIAIQKLGLAKRPYEYEVDTTFEEQQIEQDQPKSATENQETKI